MVSIFSADWRNEINRRKIGVGPQTLTPAEQAQARANISAPLKGHIFGLTLSNNSTDVTNDIDIAAGEAASTETNPVLMVLPAGLTKRLDASWAVGTNQGGLDTGSIADTTYHVWLIQRSDTGVVDVLFSASATGPTMPTNYDRKRRISSFRRESGAIAPVWQDGDVFHRIPVVDRNSASAAASALLTLSIPTGIVVAPLVSAAANCGPSGEVAINLGDARRAFADTNVASAAPNGVVRATPPPVFFSNTSAQIYFSQTNGATGPDISLLSTYGWVDTRGRDA